MVDHFLSLGLGKQSTTLYYMDALGLLPFKYKASIFADPMNELMATYEHLEALVEWGRENNGSPIIIVSKGDLKEAFVKGLKTGSRFCNLPLFTRDPQTGKVGMLKRQCTYEYKIVPVQQEIRKQQGLKKRQRNVSTNLHLGISYDEMERVTHNQTPFWNNCYPLIGYSQNERLKFDCNIPKMTKLDCVAWLIENGFPVPPSSACKFCPYLSDAQWLEIKTNNPDEWLEIVDFDKTIRYGRKSGIRQPVYLHRDCIPIDQVDFEKRKNQLSFFECSGSCHT